MESWPDWLNEFLISRAVGDSKVITSVSVKTAVNKGEHFLSTLLRAEVKYKDNNEEEVKKTSIILKTFPVGFLNNFVRENGLFLKEVKMYTSILPKISDILGKYITPNYLESCNEDVLILEDLQLNNFVNGDRIKGLDLDQCKAAIKVLAHFHGASCVLNKDYPDALEFVKTEEQFTEKNQFQKTYVINCFKIISKELLSWSGCEKYSAKLNCIKEKIWNDSIKEILPHENEINVVNHGDFWTNNILFRYNENNQITETKIIDFQFSRWTSPAIDLHYFFTSCVRNRQYESILIDCYLSYLNQLIKTTVTKSELLYALKRTECYNLLICVIMLPVLLLESSKMIDIQTIDPASAVDGVNNNPMYRVACTSDLFKKVFPVYLNYFDNISLLQ